MVPYRVGVGSREIAGDWGLLGGSMGCTVRAGAGGRGGHTGEFGAAHAVDGYGREVGQANFEWGVQARSHEIAGDWARIGLEGAKLGQKWSYCARRHGEWRHETL